MCQLTQSRGGGRSHPTQVTPILVTQALFTPFHRGTQQSGELPLGREGEVQQPHKQQGLRLFKDVARGKGP